MALQKQPVSISFKQGLNTKTDKWQLPTGQFSALTNTVFNKEGLLQKRNGYQALANAPANSQTLATLNDGLVVLGNTCLSYSSDTGKLTEAGIFQPMTLATAQMVRRATSQLTADVAVASNNLACAVFMDSDGQSYYQILDATTGQIVVPAVQLSIGATRPRAFVLGRYFIVTFLALVSGSPHLRFIAIPIANPGAPLAVEDFSTTISDLNQPYDGFVNNNLLYIAYNASDVGGAVRVSYLNTVLNHPSAAVISGVTATSVAVTADPVSNVVWVSYVSGSTISAAAYTPALIQRLAPHTIASDLTTGVPNLTALASNNALTVVYEVYNTYGYAPNTRTDYVAANTLTITGTAGTPYILSRGIGLASRACYVAQTGQTLVLVAYGQTYQPTYMLMDMSGNVLARIAYSNGGGYVLNQVLPTVNVTGTTLQVGYRYAEQLLAVNKSINPTAVDGIYAQYGINLVTMALGGQTTALEIGGSLHPSGGMLWQYDGVKIREHSFNFWPEDVQAVGNASGGGLSAQQYYYRVTYEWTDAAGNINRSAPSVPFSLDDSSVTPVGVTFHATQTFNASSTTITVDSVAGLLVGQTFIDASNPSAITAGTKITAINAGTKTITLSASPAGNSAGSNDTLQTTSIGFQASFADNSTTLQALSVSGLRVGQELADATSSAALAAGTYITAIDATNKIVTISTPTQLGSSTDTIQAAPITFTASSGNTGDTTFSISSTTGLSVGMQVSDTTTPSATAPGTTITAIGSGTITISNALLAGITGNTLTTPTILFQASFNTNSTTASVSSTSGLFPGLTLTDETNAGNLPSGTKVISVNSANKTIVLSATPTGSPGFDVILTSSLLSNTLYIPTLRQTYKTDNKVRIVIYRWSVANQEYYQITSNSSLTGDNPMVLNDPSVDYITYTDVLSDDVIVGNNLIYTTGGVIENTCSPGAVAMALWQNRLWLIDAEDQNLLRYSKVVIESTPVEMSDLFSLYVAPTTGTQGSTGPCTALSAMDDKLIIFKRDAIYYVNGSGPDNTGAGSSFSDPIFITSSVGCINPFSTVVTPSGIMFQSDKGIWILTRDLSTSYIGAPVEDYTADTLVTSAITIPGTNQVRFTLDNKTAVMYDYYFNLWGNWSNVAALSAVINEELHTYLDVYGRIVQETPSQYLDIDTPVLWSFKTGWFDLAGLQGFERFYSMNLLGQYKTPHKLFVEIGYDYNPGISQTVVVTPDNYNGPYGSDPIYGDAVYGGNSNVEKWRVFPERQKCSSFQLTIREVFDASIGVAAGAGLSLSGMLLLVGIKRGSRTQSAATSAG